MVLGNRKQDTLHSTLKAAAKTLSHQQVIPERKRATCMPVITADTVRSRGSLGDFWAPPVWSRSLEISSFYLANSRSTKVISKSNNDYACIDHKFFINKYINHDLYTLAQS